MLSGVRRGFVLGLMFVTSGWLGARDAHADCASPANAIEAENCLPGNPPSEWDISGAGDSTIQGFATDISVNRGQTIQFKVKTTAASYRLDIYRLGYYAGNGARKVATVTPSASLPQSQPACLTNSTGLYDCGNWAVSASWSVPASAMSGIYVARLVRADNGGASHIAFVVRDDAGGSDILFQTSDTTWQAYNDYGGTSLYSGSGPGGGGRAYKVSYNRPFNTRASAPEDWLFNAEYPMVRWLERNGYDVSYFTGVDADRRGAEIAEHRLYLSVGHDEYWSKQQRLNVENARDRLFAGQTAPVHLAFFSGNEIFWKTRWESSIDGSSTAYRTLVCYKETHDGAKIDPSPEWTGTWRDPRFSPPADGGRPENALSGTIFMVNGVRGDTIAVPAADGRMRFWRNTPNVSTLGAGQTWSATPESLGYEWDEDLDNGFRPEGIVRLSTTVVSVPGLLLDYGSNFGPGTATHHLVYFKRPSGALVFGSGTVQWSWGLDSNHDRGNASPSVDMQQATVNLFADMGAQPATLQVALLPASASVDLVAPVSDITSPAEGANVPVGVPLTIQGTATDGTPGLVGGVEVSVDGGLSWHPATGRESWSYTWTPAVEASYTILSRAVDDSANLESPGPGRTIVVGSPAPPPSGTVSIWGDAGTPDVANTNDPNAVELGVKFRSSVSGWITHVRFYKGSSNTGAHVGHLWSSTGTLLGTATFAAETASGWQQAPLAQPVPITAGVTYVASYHTDVGYYASSTGYFAQAVTNPPLTALADGTDGGNGLYRYGASAFPNQTYLSENYWVDVVFTSQDPSGPDTTPPSILATTPTNGATGVAVTSGVSAVFSEPLAVATVSGTTVQLRDAASQVVPATVSWSSATNSINLVPSSSLAYSTAYTATVKGGAAGVTDAAGNPLAADYVWTFATAAQAPPPPSGTVSIWGTGGTPQTANTNDANAVELGVKFRSSAAGWITHIRFYKGTSNTGTHVGHLWSATGTLLGTAAFSSETASGWQEGALDQPVAIAAGTTYVASYHTDVGFYSSSTDYFATQGVTNAPLTALADGVDGGNGVYGYGASAFPSQTYRSENYWVDVVYTAQAPGPDVTPPTVVSTTPANGASGVAIGSSASTRFSEALAPATVNGTTVSLRDAALQPVAASVSWDAATNSAVAHPTSGLAYSTTYTVTVKGGATGVTDVAGNPLASDYVWSFTTQAPPPPPPAEGPGGPILVIGYTGNPFTRYYAEILRTEGLNAFQVLDISTIDASVLAGYDVAILGQMPLSASQVTMLTQWVNAGGNLIAMRPDKQLAGLLGLTDNGTTLPEGYLLVNTATSPGLGIVGQTMQYHGTADRYSLSAATPAAATVATLYSTASSATSSPAVTLRSVGSSGGQAAAFAFDLARSIVYTRQGNPAWAGDERDGVSPVRSDDMFYGAKVGDVQKDWVDLTKVAIPQADEQQRLLANLILKMNADRMPLPRFWYLPFGKKAAVIMAEDNHGNPTVETRFEAEDAASPTGCSVDNWECIRSSVYLYLSGLPDDATAKMWEDKGFEVALHVNTNCADWTPSSLAGFYSSQIADFFSKFPSLAPLRTHRTHCIAWSDWATQPKVELANGIRFDSNYYYWPPTWVNDTPGFFTGSGMPMRFADLDGSIIDVYQSTTQMTDESGQTYPTTINTLLDRALGTQGYYGAFDANIHSDGSTEDEAAAIVASAKARGVPVVTAGQMLTWLDGRNGSSFQGITWSGGVLTFGIEVGAGANGLQAMLPTVDGAADPLSSLTRGGLPVAYSVQVIKGVEYAVFAAAAGTYQATYGAPPPDTTPPVISAVSASGSGGTATVQWSTDEPATSLVRYGTSSASLTQQASSALLLTAHSIPLGGLSSGTTYYYQVSSTDGAGNTSTSATASFVEAVETIPPTVVGTSPATGNTGVSISTSVSAVFSEALASATVNQTTVSLRDPASQVVAASVTWNPATSSAVLVPTASLAYSTTYTATVKGGASGVTDLVGNPLATDYVWTFTTQANDAVPAAGWFAGDMHVHRSCGGSPESIASVKQKMETNDLAVISLLADMGNGEVQDPAQDLPRVTGADDPISTPGRIVHWDAEWHWDATYNQYPHQALGGHIVALGLNQAQQVWEEYTYPIFQWVHQRNGIAGFAHMQYLGDTIPQSLDCCSPLEYPVEVALGSADFISEDVQGSDSVINAYYRLLNSGFRPGLAAGTDYPCGTSEIGSPLTYVQVAGGQMTYRNWIEGIAAGRTVVSRNGQNEFVALTVNGTATPGDEIRLGQGGGTVSVTARWTAKQNLSGTIELVKNGVVVSSQTASAGPGAPATLSTTVNFSKSGWLAARRMDASGHQVHTAAVFVIVNDLPIRASVADAQFYVQWIDNLLTKTAPGGAWSSFFTTSADAARARYQAAKQVYQQIAAEAGGDTTPPTVSLVSPVGGETVFQSSPYLIRWTATDDTGVTSIDVSFSSDGGTTFAPVAGCTGLAGTAQSCSWTAPGPATTQGRIRVTARDAAGLTGTATSAANFTVIAGSPSITLTAPTTAVSWAIGSTQAITFNHNLGTGASVVVDVSRDGGATWSTVNPGLVTTSATSGSYNWVVTAPATTTARARVTWAGNTAITSASAVNFTIADATAPTVSVTAPTAGSTVSGTVSVTATASDNVGVAGVQFLLDGVALGAEDTASPYSVSWNTATASAGAHTLTARARDAAGNQTTSAAVPVTVSIVVTPPGLVAAYGFEEGSGSTTADSSGLGHTGTITAGTWSTAGRFGKALSFNGTSSVVTINDAADLRLTSAMTVEAWVQPTSSSSWRCVLLKERSGGLAYALYSSEGSGRPNGYVRVGSDIDVTASSAITLNTWTHLAVTYDGATFRLYVNGTQATSRTLTGSMTTSTQPLRIGGNSVWGEYFAGLIDEVRVYNRALAAAEIQTDMNTPVKP